MRGVPNPRIVLPEHFEFVSTGFHCWLKTCIESEQKMPKSLLLLTSDCTSIVHSDDDKDIGSVDHFYDFWIQKSHHFYNFWIQKSFGPFLRFLDPETAKILPFLDPEISAFLQYLDPEIFWSIFTISGSRNHSIFEICGSRNCTISSISGLSFNNS